MSTTESAARLHQTFQAYMAADGAAIRAFIGYQRGEVSEAEVHRLQRKTSDALNAHVEAMNAIAEVSRG